VIQGLPKQTDSAGPHTRAVGCKAHSDAAMVADVCDYAFNKDEILKWIKAAIQKGYIVDTETSWITVVNPIQWIQYCAIQMGKRVKAVELYRGEFTIQAILSHPTAQYIQVEWFMKKYGHNTDHVHFNICELAGDILDPSYDSWPSLYKNGLLGDVRSIRLWEITLKE
jgi:hypothetical protein